MSRYLVVVEKTQTGFSAFCPDLPGCVATGRTKEEVEQTMQEAIAFHLDGLKEDGVVVPLPDSYSTYCEVAV